MNRKEYKRYSREFKLEAVRLAAQGERPKAQIARELGRISYASGGSSSKRRSAQGHPSGRRISRRTLDTSNVRTPGSRRRTRF